MDLIRAGYKPLTNFSTAGEYAGARYLDIFGDYSEGQKLRGRPSVYRIDKYILDGVANAVSKSHAKVKILKPKDYGLSV